MVRFWLPASAASLMACGLSGFPQNNSSAGKTKEVRFEVLSIKPMPSDGQMYSSAPTGNANPSPNGFASRLSVFQMIMLAYASGNPVTWGSMQTRNMPSWSGKFYDINAHVGDADLRAWQHQSADHELLRSAMRTLLKERCRLAVHEEPSKGEALDLVIGKHGPKLQPADPRYKDPGFKPPISRRLASGGVSSGEVVKGMQAHHYYGATMGDLVEFLLPLARWVPVYDNTGLAGRYDFTLMEQPSPPDSTPRDNPSYFLEKYPLAHLGLELKRRVETRPMLVIDHIEQPTAN